MGNLFSTQSFPLTKRSKKYGCIPDIPDHRDIWCSFMTLNLEIKPEVDLRNLMQFNYMDMNIASSVSSAVLGAYQYSQNKFKLKNSEENLSVSNEQSINFNYYNQRMITYSENIDSGGSIRDSIKVLNRLGTCLEKDHFSYKSWIYEQPSYDAYANAHEIIGGNQLVNYRRLRINIEDILKSLCMDYPVILGFNVYESFVDNDYIKGSINTEQSVFKTKENIINLPKRSDKIMGHHCGLIVGYKDNKLLIRSYLTNCSEKEFNGYLWMPFEYIDFKHCSSCWILRHSDESIKNIRAISSTIAKQSSEPYMELLKSTIKQSNDSIVNTIDINQGLTNDAKQINDSVVNQEPNKSNEPIQPTQEITDEKVYSVSEIQRNYVENPKDDTYDFKDSDHED
jgi:hypothetical protein